MLPDSSLERYVWRRLKDGTENESRNFSSGIQEVRPSCPILTYCRMQGLMKFVNRNAAKRNGKSLRKKWE